MYTDQSVTGTYTHTHTHNPLPKGRILVVCRVNSRLEMTMCSCTLMWQQNSNKITDFLPSTSTVRFPTFLIQLRMPA